MIQWIEEIKLIFKNWIKLSNYVLKEYHRVMIIFIIFWLLTLFFLLIISFRTFQINKSSVWSQSLLSWDDQGWQYPISDFNVSIKDVPFHLIHIFIESDLALHSKSWPKNADFILIRISFSYSYPTHKSLRLLLSVKSEQDFWMIHSQ